MEVTNGICPAAGLFGSDQLGDADFLEECSSSAFDFGNQRGLLQLYVMYLRGPVAFYHLGDSVEFVGIDEETRIDIRRVCNDAKPKACRPATVGHGLAHVDDFYPADRTVPNEVLLEPIPD